MELFASRLSTSPGGFPFGKTILSVLVFALSPLSAQVFQKAPHVSEGAALPWVLMDANRLAVSLRGDGQLGEPVHGVYPGAGGNIFLFNGGILVTGVVDGDTGIAASYLQISQWAPGLPGAQGGGQNGGFFELTASDGPGSERYLRWAEAVQLGAEFVDVNADGRYDPYQDVPPVMGDKMYWLPLHNQTERDPRSRLWDGPPLPIIAQWNAWAFARDTSSTQATRLPDNVFLPPYPSASVSPLTDILFFHLRLIHAGNTPVQDMYLSIAMDFDVGEFSDDLLGTDTLLQMAYIYNSGFDPIFGLNPVAAGVQLLQGPAVPSTGGTARIFRGPVQGAETRNGVSLLGITSSTIAARLAWQPFHPTVNQLRRLQMGGVTWYGDPIRPSQWGIGGTEKTNPRFMFSGDPLTGTGWRDNLAFDKDLFLSTGPFTMAPGDTQDIVYACLVGQGTDSLNSIGVLRQRARFIQNFFPEGKLVRILPVSSPLPVGQPTTFRGEGISLILQEPLQDFHWDLVERPAGSGAVLHQAADGKATLIPDVPGAYRISFQATDAAGRTFLDSTRVIAVNNRPPQVHWEVAPDSVRFGERGTVRIDHLEDPDGDSLDWQVILPAWLVAESRDSLSTTVRFRPTRIGTDFIRLVVADSLFKKEEEQALTVTANDSAFTPVSRAILNNRPQKIRLYGDSLFMLINTTTLRIYPDVRQAAAFQNLALQEGDTVKNFFREGRVVAFLASRNQQVLLYRLDPGGSLQKAGSLPPALQGIRLKNNRLLYLNAATARLVEYDVSDPFQPVLVRQGPAVETQHLLKMVISDRWLALVFQSPGGNDRLQIWSAKSLGLQGEWELPFATSDPFGGPVIGMTDRWLGMLPNSAASNNKALYLWSLDALGKPEFRDSLRIPSRLPGQPWANISGFLLKGDSLYLRTGEGLALRLLGPSGRTEPIAHWLEGFKTLRVAANSRWQVAVQDRGFFELPEMLVLSLPVEQPPGPGEKTFELFPNFPNPFNNRTNIRYRLFQPGRVQVDILNVLGQRVVQLLQAEQSAGDYRLPWDGRDNRGRSVSSGVYFLRVIVQPTGGTTGRHTEVRKMVLIR